MFLFFLQCLQLQCVNIYVLLRTVFICIFLHMLKYLMKNGEQCIE